ncbi:MAG: GNAT family N-acetyltransferase [Chloroflexi bacterium]|nr:GNAT family N-acetyltransferase [Chloroflexota bacterium]
MDCKFIPGSFETLAPHWREIQHNPGGSPVFTTPGWMQIWWQHFGSGAELLLGAVECQGTVIGIAPLRVKDGVASFIGSADVSDYLDFVVEQGKEESFFGVFLDELVKRGIRQLDLESLRPDSTALTSLAAFAGKRGWQVSRKQSGVTVALDLPATWEGYLDTLTTKQRHELRRKERRLSEMGELKVRASDAAGADMDIFLKLFRDSRQDKKDFMTPAMEAFFRSLAATLSAQGILKLKIMELDSLPVAAVLCFDYHNRIYLYNSGYDPGYAWLSVGLLSKVLCIKESIRIGREKFDFLSGAEVYKYRLGGQELPLFHCRMSLEENHGGGM